MINVNRKRVEEYLQTKLQRLEARPNLWIHLEGAGRCLRYLDDPRAQTYFQQAAQHYPLFAEDASSHIQQANLHRLAGDTEQAQHHYQRAYDLLMPLDLTNKENDVKMDRLALCAYMLGDDPLTIEAVNHLRSMSRKKEWLNTFGLADLAAARQQHDLERASAAIVAIEEAIRTSRFQPSGTGSFTPWDTYEEARRVVRALGGDPDAPEEATA